MCRPPYRAALRPRPFSWAPTPRFRARWPRRRRGWNCKHASAPLRIVRPPAPHRRSHPSPSSLHPRPRVPHHLKSPPPKPRPAPHPNRLHHPRRAHAGRCASHAGPVVAPACAGGHRHLARRQSGCAVAPGTCHTTARHAAGRTHHPRRNRRSTRCHRTSVQRLVHRRPAAQRPARPVGPIPPAPYRSASQRHLRRHPVGRAQHHTLRRQRQRRTPRPLHPRHRRAGGPGRPARPAA